MAFIGTETHHNEVFSSLETLADIPLTDQATWEMYQKHREVFSTSRLLDMQNIPWSIYYSKDFCLALNEFQGQEPTTIGDIDYGDTVPGIVFAKKSLVQGKPLVTDAVILKGELKWLAHHTDKDERDGDKIFIGRKVLDEIHGEVELRIAAFTKIALPKFTGVISVDTIGTAIAGVRLHMTPEVISQFPEDWLKNVIRLYNRKQWPK